MTLSGIVQVATLFHLDNNESLNQLSNTMATPAFSLLAHAVQEVRLN
jgi:hypothetical protein